MTEEPFDPIEFWKDPPKTKIEDLIISMRGCLPGYFLDLVHVSQLVVDVMDKYAQPDWSILEIGCGTGRNLVALQEAGYKNVAGIEVSRKTVAFGRKHFPDYKKIPVTIGPAEQVIEDVPDYDVIFTQSCLMHVPHESLLDAIASKARRLILTNEAELARRPQVHVWRRDYQQVFEALGWRQVEWEEGGRYPPLPQHTIKRVFVRK